MYAYIEGTVADKSSNTLVIEAGGIGYEILSTSSALTSAPPRGETMRVYTYLNVLQDGVELLGFASLEEKKMFLRLTGVSGIGSRSAFSILGSMPLKELTLAIMTGDIAMLSRAPGVGKKTAQRLALELKDKVSADDISGDWSVDALQSANDAPAGAVGEAILALQSLGYTQTEAARAVAAARKSAAETDKADELVRLALRGIMKG